MTDSATDGVSVPGVSDVRRYVTLGRKRVSVGWRRLVLDLARSPHLLDAERAMARLPNSPRVLVLCLGNICRSPMAERYLRARLNDRGIEQVTVESAGFVESENRPSPDHAVTAADEYGVDLSDHGSTLVTEEALDRSDLVVLMDAYNYVLLERRFDGMTGDAVFLGAFADGDEYEIPDPYGTEVAEFRRVYGEIADALDAFVDRIAGETE